MTITIRRILSRAALPLMLILGFTVQAQTEVVRNVDGSVSITIDGQEVTVSATLAGSIIDALRENAGDPQALQAAVQAIVADNAGGENRAALASAIAAFAASMSSGDSEVVAAIVSGAAAANPAVFDAGSSPHSARHHGRLPAAAATGGAKHGGESATGGQPGRLKKTVPGPPWHVRLQGGKQAVSPVIGNFRKASETRALSIYDPLAPQGSHP